MAQQIFQYHFAIPAGTPQATPASSSINVPPLTIERVELEVPHGPAGTMGFQIFDAGTPWKPDFPGDWLVWDGKTDGWWLTNQPTGGKWEIVGYNTGKYPHTVFVRFFLVPLPKPQPAATPTFAFVTHPAGSPNVVVL